ncbi:MAG: SAF domain-containing protein [Myxococcaceae bacterium]
MKKRHFVLGLLLSTVLLSIAIAAAYRLVFVEARKGWRLETVLVAMEPLSAGTNLRSEIIGSRKVPEQFRFKSMFALKDVDALVGRTLLVNVEAGEPILSSFVLPPAIADCGVEAQPTGDTNAVLAARARVQAVNVRLSNAFGPPDSASE